MLHIPITVHDDRPAGPCGTSAGRGVIAGLGAGVVVIRISVLLLPVVRLASGTLECARVRARTAALAAAVWYAITGYALLILASRN